MDPITMSPGNPNADETLLGILQRLRDLSQQPLVPQNPLAQLGTVMQGFAAGTQGQQNPALQMYAQQRQSQMGGLAHEATIGSALNTVQNQQAERKAQQSRLHLDVIKGLPDTTPETRTYKFNALQGFAKAQGLDIPADLMTGLIAGAATPAKLEEVAKLVIRGYTQSDGKLAPGAVMSDQAIASLIDLPVSYVSQTRQAFLANPNVFLDSISKKTLTALAQEETTLKQKNFDAMVETQAPELHGNPALRPFMLLAARSLYKKEYWELSSPERQKVFAQASQSYADQQGVATGERAFYALMAKQDAAKTAPAKDYFNANPPYGPLSSSTTVQTAQALEATKAATHVPQKNDQQALKYVNQLKSALDEYRDAILSLPEYFPKETGNKLQDLTNLGVAAAKFHSGAARTDPRTVPLTAIKRHVINLARLSGTGARMSNYVAELERASGGFDTVAGQDVKTGLANQVETFLNSQLEAMGFNPLPKYIQGKIVRLSTGTVVRILPDGTQYVIGAQ